MEILVVLIFLALLFGGGYWYAGYSTRSGFAKDENQNFIPDAWEEKYGVDDPEGDEDNDGLTNIEEFEARTKPDKADSSWFLNICQVVDFP